MVLEAEPAYREYKAADLLEIHRRTIQRKLLTGEFPKPDFYKPMGKRKIPYWKLSTLKAYEASRRIVP